MFVYYSQKPESIEVSLIYVKIIVWFKISDKTVFKKINRFLNKITNNSKFKPYTLESATYVLYEFENNSWIRRNTK